MLGRAAAGHTAANRTPEVRTRVSGTPGAMNPPAFASAGRWFRGNLHTHPNRSDGMAPPRQVIAEYRAAGYDFLVLTDHFEARWDWTVTDTSSARDRSFTTLLGAELSSADWDDEDVFWINAIGLPASFTGLLPGEPHVA